MGKVSPRRMPHHHQRALEDDLLRALKAILQKRDEQLLLVLLTQSEQMMVARRVQVAKRLLAGWTIQEIRRDLHVGQATVEAVEKWLQKSFEQYRDVLPSLYQEMREHAREARRRSPPDPYTFRWLRRKYPLHFLLFNLLLDDVDFYRGGRGRHRKQQLRALSYTAPSAAEARRVLE